MKAQKFKKAFKKLKQWFLYYVIGSSIDKHKCKENREFIEKLPLYEGNSPMSPPNMFFGYTYNVKCKVCGIDWWQNYP